MDNQSSTPTPGSELERFTTMGFFQRLTAIYFEPEKCFAEIRRKGSWFGLFLIVAALAAAATYTLTTRMDYETYMRKALQMNPFSQSMSEEQIQQILARPRNKFQQYFPVLFAPIGVFLGYLVLGGIFLGLFVLMGASISYKRSLAVTIWAMAPPTIIMMILSIVFTFVKEPDTLDLNPANNVVSNFGLAVSPKEQPALHSILSSIDLFSFWTIYLLSVGFSTVSDTKFTAAKAAKAILILWGLYVLGKMGFAVLLA